MAIVGIRGVGRCAARRLSGGSNNKIRMNNIRRLGGASAIGIVASSVGIDGGGKVAQFNGWELLSAGRSLELCALGLCSLWRCRPALWRLLLLLPWLLGRGGGGVGVGSGGNEFIEVSGILGR
jgi:hypothetical protein